jgi:dTMP kinase
MTGKHIVFEGSDGSGKSSMTKVAVKYLSEKLGADRVVSYGHPGSTEIGKEIRKLVKHSDAEIDVKTEQMLMACDLNAFTEQILKPALAEGKIVISDRCNVISGLAYGSAGGLDTTAWIDCGPGKYGMNGMVAEIDWPPIDFLIVCRCSWETAKARMEMDVEKGNRKVCRFESRGEEFFQKVIKFYDDLCEKHFTDVMVGAKIQGLCAADGNKNLEDASAEIIEAMDYFISKKLSS